MRVRGTNVNSEPNPLEPHSHMLTISDSCVMTAASLRTGFTRGLTNLEDKRSRSVTVHVRGIMQMPQHTLPFRHIHGRPLLR